MDSSAAPPLSALCDREVFPRRRQNSLVTTKQQRIEHQTVEKILFIFKFKVNDKYVSNYNYSLLIIIIFYKILLVIKLNVVNTSNLINIFNF